MSTRPLPSTKAPATPAGQPGVIDSRRSALSQGAGLLAAGMAFGAVFRPPPALALPNGDSPLLNSLLSAEWSAIAAYRAASAYLAAPSMADAMASSAPTVLAVAAHFMAQHEEHARELRAAVMAAGLAPAEQSSVTFAPPATWSPSVVNVLKLAANAEKAASISYAEALKQLSAASAASLVASIGGAETQHFVILSLLLNGVVAPTPSTLTMATSVVPRAFTASPAGDAAGLETVADFAYSA